MAADGTIVIETAIKDAGFKAGTKELEQHMKRVAQSVEGMSQKQQIAMQKAVDALSKQNAAYAQQEQKVAKLRDFDNISWKLVSDDTAVKTLKTVNAQSGAIYNLSGQKVDANYKGVVIINGKKVLMK